MYNFEVEDYHTYYVSNAKVLVHNSGDCDVTPGSPHSNITSGDNKFTQTGKTKHKELSEKVKQKDGWSSERDAGFTGKDGKWHQPDVKTPSGNYLEYKPDTRRGRSRGRSEIKKYKMQNTDPNAKFRVIYYKP